MPASRSLRRTSTRAAADTGRLELVESPPEYTVWLYWCRGDDQQRTEKVMRALGKGAKFGAEYCRIAVGEPFPPQSQPGQPPHKRTGMGQWSIEWGSSRARWAGYVRTQMPAYVDFNYMAFHDQRQRPWLFSSLHEIASELERRIASWLRG